MSFSRSLSTSSTSSTGSFKGVIKLPGLDSKKGGRERDSLHVQYMHACALCMIVCSVIK